MSYLAFALAALLPQVAAVSPDNPQDIVVIGRRLQDAQAALDQCLDRHCPVDQDVAATLKLANVQFLAGNYREARQTLRRSLLRNKGSAKSYPVPVASLWQAKGTVDAHLGEYDDVRTNGLQAFQALRKGLPDTDPEVLAGRIDLGDMWFHVGDRAAAELAYRAALSHAEKAGDKRTVAISRYRLANLVALRSPTVGSGDEKAVAELLAPLIGSSDPALARFDFAARLFKARLAERRGAKGAVDAVFASLPPGVNPPPRSLSSTPIKLPSVDATNCAEDNGQTYHGQVAFVGCQNPANLVSGTNVERQWIDIGFWITPDGGVRDIDVVRRSSKYAGDWEEAVTKSIGSRRYSASKVDATDREFYRVERFTLTAPYQNATGSRIRSRAASPVIELADLTPG